MIFRKTTQPSNSSEGVTTPAPSLLPAPYPGCWANKEFMREYKRNWQRACRQRQYALRDQIRQAERDQIHSLSRMV